MNTRPANYEKPTIRRHAVIMTMAPAGSKMGHGLFAFVTKRPETPPEPELPPDRFAYRRV
jgi:hypothetical protein